MNQQRRLAHPLLDLRPGPCPATFNARRAVYGPEDLTPQTRPWACDGAHLPTWYNHREDALLRIVALAVGLRAWLDHAWHHYISTRCLPKPTYPVPAKEGNLYFSASRSNVTYYNLMADPGGAVWIWLRHPRIETRPFSIWFPRPTGVEEHPWDAYPWTFFTEKGGPTESIPDSVCDRLACVADGLRRILLPSVPFCDPDAGPPTTFGDSDLPEPFLRLRPQHNDGGALLRAAREDLSHVPLFGDWCEEQGWEVAASQAHDGWLWEAVMTLATEEVVP